jgi:hypothetical protein
MNYFGKYAQRRLGLPAHFIRRLPRHWFLPKAYHFVIGFVVNLGASLDEFAADIAAILDLKII